MDSIPQDATQQPISDDQELAKALAGVLPETQSSIPPVPSIPVSIPGDPAMQFQETPIAPTIPAYEPIQQVDPIPTYDQPAPGVTPIPISVPGSLEDIKKNALIELRPLIDKVTLPIEEKFDTYLMLIRSTDDSSLIGPAHEAAQAIPDETRRAEALLDIIKEIDYLSNSGK